MKDIIIILLVVLLVGCKKDTPVVYSETVLTGHVTNLVTNGPMVNAPIYILYSKETYSIGVTSTIIDTIYTDFAGNYTYKFTRKYEKPNKSYRYLYNVSLPTDKLSSCNFIYEIPTEGNYTINFLARYYKTLSLHLKVQRHDRGYIITQLKMNTLSSCGSGYGGAERYEKPNPINDLDTLINFPYVPQGLNYNLNIVLANKVNNQYRDSVLYTLAFPIYSDTTLNYTVL